MSAIHLEQEFPIGFAENRDQAGEETEYYVEWLDNSAEFPGLAAASTLNNANLNGGNWELLQRKELNDEDNIVEEDDEGAWSKISTADQHPLYAQVTEKNAAELQPTKRRIQPLWPLQPTRAKHSDDKQDAIDEDTYQDDLGAELIDIHKAQSRRANRMGKLRKYHDLKTIDLHVQAYSPKGAADVVWLPHDTSDPSAIISQHIFNMNADPKAQALRYASRFSHNFKKYACKSNNTKHPSFPDNGEYSVHSPIVKS
ncbi:hypothetical protein PS6_007468 [Mucor atramentarius]